MRLLVFIVAVAICGCSYMRHPTNATTWGKPVGTMVLGLEARDDVINAFIENRGGRPQRIIAKGITLTIARQGGDAGAGQVTEITDASVIPLDREESFETLEPREHLVTQISVGKLPSGTYTVVASYGDKPTQQIGDWWTGTLTAGPITLVVP